MGRYSTTTSVKTLSVKKPKINYPKYLGVQLQEYEQIPVPEFEHRFHPTRKWRFDMAFIKEKVAVEIEGAVWIQGRHTRGSGFIKDMEKYNEATFYGWSVLRFTTGDVKTGAALKFLKKYFIGEKYIE